MSIGTVCDHNTESHLDNGCAKGWTTSLKMLLHPTSCPLTFLVIKINQFCSVKISYYFKFKNKKINNNKSAVFFLNIIDIMLANNNVYSR